MESNDSKGDFDEATMEMLSNMLPSNAFHTSAPDPRLERAWQETERTNQVTPILKEELRLRILTKRLKKGEPDIDTSSVEPKSYELTEEEKRKRERRKEQNRRAAKKCREKRKMKNLSDAERSELITKKNQKLKDEVMSRRHTLDVLANFVKNHILDDLCPHAKGTATNKEILEILTASSGPGSARPLEQSLPVARPTKHDGSRKRKYPFEPAGCGAQAARADAPPPSSLGVAEVPEGEEMFLKVSADHVGHHGDFHACPEFHDLSINGVSSLLLPGVDLNFPDRTPVDTDLSHLSPINLFTSAAHGSFSVSPVAMTTGDAAKTTLFSPEDSSLANSFLNGKTDEDSMLTTHGLSDTYAFRAISFGDQPGGPVTATSSLGPCADEGPEPPTYSLLQNVAKMSDFSLLAATSSSSNNSSSAEHIVNTVLFEANVSLDFINSYLNDHTNSSQMSSCDGDFFNQTGPTSPMTPLSPDSPTFTLPPCSPNSLSADVPYLSSLLPDTLQELSSAVASPAPSGTPEPGAPVRPVMRRTSSTVSVPSPHGSLPFSSSSLSPPPSVPSPSSNGVPESPSILGRFVLCDNNIYIPQYSPVSSIISGDVQSPIRYADLSEEEYISSSCTKDSAC